MKIDWEETKKAFDELYMQTKVARSIGVNGKTFHRILAGQYPYMDSARAKAVVAKLKELKVLRFEGQEANQAA